MIKKFSLKTFLRKYPTDEACLEEIKNIRWPDGIICPNCKKITPFYKISNRTAYSCGACRFQVFPLAGTIFEKSTTPLRFWFYAMFQMIKTRSGISAKQLERELGVTYKTAHRMFKQIRVLMAEPNTSFSEGEIEVDETFIGGKGKNRAFKWRQGVEEKEKEIIIGMVKRNKDKKGANKIYLKHIPNTGKWTLLSQIKEHIDPKARVITDQYRGYWQLPKYGYRHDFVNHKHTFVKGDIHTQNAENFWSILKRGIYGVYRIVSKKYLQAYADEYAWRYNHRKQPDTMFDELLKQVALVRVLKTSSF